MLFRSTTNSPAINSELVININDPDYNPGGTIFNYGVPPINAYEYFGQGLTIFTGPFDNNAGCPPLPLYKAYDIKNKISDLENLVTDDKQFSLFSIEQHYDALLKVYGMLLHQPELLDSSKLLHIFYDSVKNSNIGAIVKTESALGNGDFKKAEGYMAYFIPQNRTERNYKKFYTVYSHYIQNKFSVTDEYMLTNLISDCPMRDGLAVNKARALHNIIYKDFKQFDDNCTDTIAETYCDNTICGGFNDSFDCGGGAVVNDTLYIVDNNKNFASSVSPALTDKDGNFRFDAEEISTLDPNELYNIVSKSGFELTGYEPMTVAGWINENPLTLSSNQNVNQEWVAKYRGPDELNDNAIALDLAQNVYVVGRSVSSGVGNRFAVVKYDIAGNEKWATRFDNEIQNFSSLVMSAVKVDPSSNVFVAGIYKINIDQETSAYGLVVAKIDESGNLLWGEAYDNFFWINKNPSIIGLYLDQDDNVIVGCNYYPEDGFIIAKYDGETHELLWSIDKTDISSEGVELSVNSMIVDQDDNIIFSGKVSTDWAENGNYFTYKLNPEDMENNKSFIFPGTFETIGEDGNWVATSNIADDDGNIYVTGYSSDDGATIATVKYDPLNEENNWVSILTAEEMNYDWIAGKIPNKMLLDKNGYIYVFGAGGDEEGNSYYIIKYDLLGDVVWKKDHLKANNFMLSAAAIDADGKLYFTGSSFWAENENNYSSYYTAKVDGDLINDELNVLWETTYNGQKNYDRPSCIKISSNGNVYVTGSSAWSDEGQFEFATLKYGQCPSRANLRNLSHSSDKPPTLENQYVKVYPNPAKDEFYVEYFEDAKGQEMVTYLYNIYGGLVKKVQTNNQNKLTVNTKDITSGIYFYKVMVGNTNVGNNKIVIIR